MKFMLLRFGGQNNVVSGPALWLAGCLPSMDADGGQQICQKSERLMDKDLLK